MAASTLRFAIIVALVVGGIVVINQAFPASQGGATGPIDDGAAVTTTTTTTASPTEAPRETTASPTVVGVRIAVFNGAGVTGLAGDVTDRLTEEYGYVAIEPADAPSPVPVTTIYFRKNRDRIEAEFLANDFFKRLDDVRVTKLSADSDIDPEVQLAVFLGNDYAALRG
ncbi:MAG TPA: LytR C-terminal domain-containing protein [Actinomycetota bacterium]